MRRVTTNGNEYSLNSISSSAALDISMSSNSMDFEAHAKKMEAKFENIWSMILQTVMKFEREEWDIEVKKFEESNK